MVKFTYYKKGQDGYVYGITKDGKGQRIFNNIYVSKVMTNVVTNEITAEIVMEMNGATYQMLIPRQNIEGKTVIKLFKAVGFQCMAECADDLELWLLFYTEPEADRVSVYDRLGYCSNSDGSKEYYYPSLQEATYIGNKNVFQVGSIEIFMDMVHKLYQENSDIALLFGIGLSAPVVSRLNVVEKLVISITNRTSTGKSTALRLCSSLYGDSSNASSAVSLSGLIDTFNSTYSALQAKLANIDGFPVFIDESSSVGDDLPWQRLSYELSQGVGRARCGTDGSLKPQTSWKTTIVMTSEKSIHDYLENAGAKNRIIEVPVIFFTSKENAEMCSQIVTDNYGHIAPLFLKLLNEISDEELLSLYKESCERLDSMYPNVEHREFYRLLHRIAILDVTSTLALRVENLNFFRQEDLINSYKKLADHYLHRITDPDNEMFELLCNCIASNLLHFNVDGTRDDSNYRYDTDKNCYGKVAYEDGRYICYILTDLVHKWLNLDKATAKSTFSRWKEKGLLYKCLKNRNTCYFRHNGVRAYAYSFEILKSEQERCAWELRHMNILSRRTTKQGSLLNDEEPARKKNTLNKLKKSKVKEVENTCVEISEEYVIN